MKQKIIQLAIILLISYSCFGQKREKNLTEEEWSQIITYLTTENWEKAEKLTLSYINQFPNNDSLADPAILRYMYIRCVAGQLSEHKYSPKTAMKKVEKCIGKTIITPPLEFNPNRMFNGIRLSDDSTSFFSCSSNNDMTNIHCFESYFFDDPEILNSTNDLIGKNIRIGAFIKSIENVGVTMPGFKIIFERSFIWDEDE